MYGKCWRHTLQTVWPAKAKDNLILRSSSMLVNGNGGLKIPHALTCARSQQKCSEGRLDKTTTKMQPIPQRNEKRLKKQTPFSRPKRYGHVTIPCKWRCFSDVFFSARCKYSDFRQILTFQCLKNIWIFPHSFWRTDVFLQMRTTSRFDLLLQWLWCFCVVFATSRAKLLGVWYEVCEFKTNFNKFLSSTLCDARNNRKRRLRRKLKHLAPVFWFVPLVSWFLCGIKDAFICQV